MTSNKMTICRMILYGVKQNDNQQNDTPGRSTKLHSADFYFTTLNKMTICIMILHDIQQNDTDTENVLTK